MALYDRLHGVPAPAAGVDAPRSEDGQCLGVLGDDLVDGLRAVDGGRGCTTRDLHATLRRALGEIRPLELVRTLGRELVAQRARIVVVDEDEGCAALQRVEGPEDGRVL